MLTEFDQKRHVVVDHLDDGVGRLPAVLLDLRIVRPDLGLAGLALLPEAEMRERRAVQVQGVAIDQVRRRHALVVVMHEALGERGEVFVQLVVQTPDHPLEQIGFLVLKPGRHGSLPSAIGSVYHRWRRPYSAASPGEGAPARTMPLRPGSDDRDGHRPKLGSVTQSAKAARPCAVAARTLPLLPGTRAPRSSRRQRWTTAQIGARIRKKAAGPARARREVTHWGCFGAVRSKACATASSPSRPASGAGAASRVWTEAARA